VPEVKIYHYEGEIKSGFAAQTLERFFRDQREARVGEAVAARGLPENFVRPFEIRRENVAPPQKVGGNMIGAFVPYIIIILCLTGAMYPAIDLTAGEKERGTAETTMLLPIPRLAVQQGKILAVAALAVVATFLNLVAIGFSAEQLFATLASTAEVEIDLPVLALVAVAPLALLFAFFVAAALTGIASLARTFKEGQALLGPVQMVFILPAMIGVIPGIELSVGWALVPVVNVVLAFKALLVGRELYLEYTLTALAQVAYAWLALRVSVRLLSREAVLFARGTIPFRRLLATLRSAGGTD
jgi:sodium transport system permease protein